MAVDFFIKATNELAILEFDVTDEDGVAIDLTGATAAYRIWSTTPGTTALYAITPTVNIPTPTAGHVRVTWTSPSGDLDVAGRYYGACDITFSSGNHLTVPTIGFHQLLVGELGPTT